jgi:hypothetical protein
MNPEPLENRVAFLEKRVEFLERCNQEYGVLNGAVISILASMGDQTLEKDHKMLEMTVNAQANNERMFSLFAILLPTEEIRKDFQRILNHLTVNRDQIEAALELMKNQPKPSDVLKKIGLKNLSPPAAPPAPPA